MFNVLINSLYLQFNPIFSLFSSSLMEGFQKNKGQAVAELGQTQVKLEVVNDVVVNVRI